MTFEKDLNDILRGSQYTIYNKQDDIEANLNSSVFRADWAANLSLSYQAHISPLSLGQCHTPNTLISTHQEHNWWSPYCHSGHPCPGGPSNQEHFLCHQK